MSQSEWIEHPPSGAVWVVEDSITQLTRLGLNIGRPLSDSTPGVLNFAKAIFEDERVWAHAPAVIDHVSRAAFRARLGAALNHCRGYN